MTAEKASAWIEKEVAELKERCLFRETATHAIASPAAPFIELDEKRLLLLCSNNYLGLAADPRLAAAAAQAAKTHGTGSGASRLVSGTQPLHLLFEQRLARFKQTEDCVLFSSGYLANFGTIAALVGRGDTVVSDAWNHASIIDGCRLSGAAIAVYPHADVEACGRLLAEARQKNTRRILLCSDSIFSMDGDLAPLAELAELARRYEAMTLIDEAHATGISGNGHGAIIELGLAGQFDAVVGTCSKALGSAGGFVAGSKMLCDYLRNRARSFVFDTAPPPPTVAATLCALQIVEENPALAARARSHAHRLYQALGALGYRVREPAAAIVPVLIGESADAVKFSARLQDHGILARAIRPPTVPPGTARIRLCPMASHSDADISAVIAAFSALRD